MFTFVSLDIQMVQLVFVGNTWSYLLRMIYLVWLEHLPCARKLVILFRPFLVFMKTRIGVT